MKSNWRISFWAAAITSIVLVVLISNPQWMAGSFDDVDSYERMAWLEWSLNNGSLQHYQFTREFWPQGFQIHWTLPMNLLIFVLALPFYLYQWNWHSALASCAPLVAPVQFAILLASIVILSRAMGLRASSRAWIAIALCLSPAILAYARVGRISHHTLSMALAALALATAILLIRRPKAKQGMLAAFCAVLCCWESMETLPIIMLAGFLVWLATFYKRDLGGFTVFASTLVPLSILVCITDPDPSGWQAFTPDRFSLFHVLGFTSLALILAINLVIEVDKRQNTLLSLIAVTFVGLISGFILFLFFPRIPNNPMFYSYFWNQIIEIKSIWQEPEFSVLLITPQIPALAIAWLVLKKKWDRPQRWLWLLIFISLLGLTVLGAFYLRLAAYSCILACPLVAATIAKFFSKALPREQEKFVLMICAIMLGIRTTITFILFLTGIVVQDNQPFQLGEDYAKLLQKEVPAHTTIAADLYLNAEILWRTQLRTLAGPYHRNEEGIENLGTIFSSTNDNKIKNNIRQDHVEALLLYSFPPYNNFPVFDKNSLRNRLLKGDIPNYLIKSNSLSRGPLQFYWVLTDQILNEEITSIEFP